MKECFALVAQMHPAYNFRGGTANLIKTMCSYPSHPFCSVVSADHTGPNPVPGPWDSIPTLSLFRPRSLFPNLRLGLGLLDNIAFRLQKNRVARFLKKQGVKRQLALITNNTRFALLVDNLPPSIPRDLYIIDDPVADSSLYRMNEEKAQQTMDRLVRESDRIFAISPVYASDLETRYGRPCEFLPIPVSDALLESARQDSSQEKSSPDGAITIHHSGQIHHLYADAIANIISFLKKIAEKKKIKINLELWGNINGKDLEKSLGIALQQEEASNFKIKLCGEVSPVELSKEQKRADFLLLVNSFLPKMEKQIRCSFSSKSCEYMVSGVPIIVYGPSYSGPAVYLDKHKAAHVITTTDFEEALRQIEQVICDPGRKTIVETAKKLALNRHSSEAFFKRLAF